MTIVDSINKIAKWLDKGICQEFSFKVPPKKKNEDVEKNYQYELAHPIALPLFIPAKDKIPPKYSTNMPAVAVQIMQGEDEVGPNRRTIDIQLGICTWNPGIHAKDVFYPKGTEPEEPQPYQLSYDGWMDTWNFIDALLRELESTSLIDGMEIVNNSIKFGPYKEQETVVDMWPLWAAYIQFSVRSDFLRNNKELEKLL